MYQAFGYAIGQMIFGEPSAWYDFAESNHLGAATITGASSVCPELVEGLLHMVRQAHHERRFVLLIVAAP
jgi:hypothetical protein